MNEDLLARWGEVVRGMAVALMQVRTPVEVLANAWADVALAVQRGGEGGN